MLSTVLLLTACVSVATHTPGVTACLTSGSPESNAPSRGALAIIPSQVPGVEIDSATWSTYAETMDLSAVERLTYVAHLRATRDVWVDEVALLYETPGARSTAGGLDDFGDATPRYVYQRGGAFLRPGTPRRAMVFVSLQNGSRIGLTSALRYCPRSVRLIPQRDLALHLQPLVAEARQRAWVIEAHSQDTVPLVVVADTLVELAYAWSVVTGAALNTTDTTLHHMVVAFVLQKLSNKYATVSAADSAGRDTLEYYLDSIPPHALVGFAGGQYEYLERVIQRTTYPSSTIRGRPIAGYLDKHRSSVAKERPRAPKPFSGEQTLPRPYRPRAASGGSLATPMLKLRAEVS
ncbi:MAG: hypothetical protein ACJ8AD_15395 [Gemmatimonadaceae bacterium]